jgi:hypothetical protein
LQPQIEAWFGSQGWGSSNAKELRICGEDLITMSMVGAVVSVLALVFAILVRAPDGPFVSAAQLQTSLAASSDQ